MWEKIKVVWELTELIKNSIYYGTSAQLLDFSESNTI